MLADIQTIGDIENAIEKEFNVTRGLEVMQVRPRGLTFAPCEGGCGHSIPTGFLLKMNDSRAFVCSEECAVDAFALKF